MAVEHSQDKRQLAAWVDRKLAETVDEVASKRGNHGGATALRRGRNQRGAATLRVRREA